MVIGQKILIRSLHRTNIDPLGTLAPFGSPVFLRISPEIETTGTFKYKKTDLVKDGFDPNTITDELYFADTSTNQYVKLDANLFQKIHNQEVRI